MTPTPDYYIGLDLGTTSVKACAFDRGGGMLAKCERAYPLLHPEPGAAVQDPQELLRAAEESLMELIKTTKGIPGGIGLSCPMHGLLLLDKEYQSLNILITWADVRPQAAMAQFTERDRLEFLAHTGTPIHPMSPLLKLRWLADTAPEQLIAASYAADLKSFLVHNWTTDGLLVDEQLASATGLLDVETGRWSDQARGFLPDGLPSLPTVRPAKTRLHWREDVAERLGLAGIPLFLGGSDGVLANLGSGLLAPGEVALTVGTSGAVRATHRQARVDPAHGLFNYRMFEDYFVIGGATNNGGKVLEYWQGLLSTHFQDVGSFIDAACAVSAADSPTFLPHLYGERAPIWDATATAQLTGLRGHHDHRHLARAVLEGVTDNLVAILRQLEAAVGPAQRIHVSGGITRSPEWLSLLAQKTERTVVEAETAQASAYGAALIARLGMGDLTLADICAG